MMRKPIAQLICISVLLSANSKLHAQQQIQFTGEITMWVSLFEPQSDYLGNSPLSYEATVSLGAMQDAWNFQFLAIDNDPFQFPLPGGRFDGMHFSSPLDGPLLEVNEVTNSLNSLDIEYAYGTTFEAGINNPGLIGEYLNLSLNKNNGSGSWSWSRFRNCPVCDFAFFDPAVFAATITDIQIISDSYTTDFDRDGDVDGFDLTHWTSAYGNGLGGDANGDFETNGEDFLLWQRSHTGNLSQQSSSVSTVPEPKTFVSLLVGLTIIVTNLHSSKRLCAKSTLKVAAGQPSIGEFFKL